MVKAFFRAKNIEFEEKNVASDTDAREDMINKTGQFGVPVIEIGEDLVIGFNQPIIKKLLEIN
jgi:glutaredoxin